jgi:hypothetical protein
VKVLTSVNAVTAMISKCIVPNQPPGIRCIIRLIEALVYPVIQYGMPVWRPSADQQSNLDKLIARPARQCLSLPSKSTAIQSVLTECGLLSTNSLYELSSLRLGARILLLDAQDPCKQLYFADRNPIATEIRRIQRHHNIQCDNSAQMLSVRDRIEQAQFDSWKFESKLTTDLQGVKQSPGTSLYMLRDTRPVCNLRARLRFNRCGLNASLAQRRVVPSPLCLMCGVDETVEHCLLECDSYDIVRNTCKNRLEAETLPMNLAVILGDEHAINSLSVAAALSITGDFLIAIHAIRKL